MTEPEEVMSMLRRFENEMRVKEEAENSDDVIHKFKYWTGRETSKKQETLLRKYTKQYLDLPVKYPRRPIGVAERKGIPREKLRRRYTTHLRKGKRYTVARIPKGKVGAGRFARRT